MREGEQEDPALPGTPGPHTVHRVGALVACSEEETRVGALRALSSTASGREAPTRLARPASCDSATQGQRGFQACTAGWPGPASHPLRDAHSGHSAQTSWT